MGTFDFKMDALEKELAYYSAKAGKGLADKVLQSCAVPVKNELLRLIRRHESTGEMARSVAIYKTKQFSNGGYYTVVAPTGKSWEYKSYRGKKYDRSFALRNVEKLAYIEYGTIKQRGEKIFEDAIYFSQEKVYDTMQQIFNEYTGENS